jgi:predicted nucleic acid-binding protein
MAFKVVLDANVLYPFSLRDTLLRFAERELYVPFWSERILDEVARNLVADDRGDAATAARLQAAMRSAFPDALVHPDAIAAIEPTMTNDPGDRHVLAAAVVSGAEAIVTFNARHFPDAALAPFGKQQIHPDDFLCTLLDIAGLELADAIVEQAGDLTRPPLTPAQLLDLLQLGQVGTFVSRIREILALPPRTEAEILIEREAKGATSSSDDMAGSTNPAVPRRVSAHR